MNSETDSPTPINAVRVDLTETKQDTTLSLAKRRQRYIHQNELLAHIGVYDLDQVFATDTALAAIKSGFLTVPYLIELYADNYVDKLFRKATRGNDKGKLILDPEASTFVHHLRDGNELIVQGETVEVNGTYTRRLTISCCNEKLQGGVQ